MLTHVFSWSFSPSQCYTNKMFLNSVLAKQFYNDCQNIVIFSIASSTQVYIKVPTLDQDLKRGSWNYSWNDSFVVMNTCLFLHSYLHYGYHKICLFGYPYYVDYLMKYMNHYWGVFMHQSCINSFTNIECCILWLFLHVWLKFDSASISLNGALAEIQALFLHNSISLL